MTPFKSLKQIIPLTSIGLATNIRKLNPIQLHIFLMLYSFCYKGKRYKSMNLINSRGIKIQIKEIYGIEITRRQFDYACSKIVKLGLLDRRVAIFSKKIGNTLLPTKNSYYRLVSRETTL